MKSKLDREIDEYKLSLQDIETQVVAEKEENARLKRQLSEHAMKKQLLLQQKKMDKLNQKKEQLEATVQSLTTKLLKAEEKIAAFDLHKSNVDKFEVERLKRKEEKLQEKLQDQMRSSITQNAHYQVVNENQKMKSKVDEVLKKEEILMKDRQEWTKKIEDLNN